MRILGIDFGSSSIKAVEMDSAFGRYDIHDYHEHTLTPGESFEESVGLLMKSLTKAPDRMIVSLPTGQSTFRNLVLPTRDKKAIQAGVGFELDDELPFPIEDCTYDFAVLTQSKQGSVIHVAATLKRHVISAIELCQKAQIDPEVMTTEAWAYRTLLNRVLGTQSQEAPVLLAQLGHEKSTFYLHWRGAPALTHEIPWGGRELTAAICSQYGITLEQAEGAKLDRGFVSTSDIQSDITPEQSEFSECLEKSLQTLIVELKQVELMCRSVTRHSIHAIYLAGGTSLLPGLGGWIEERVKTPTRPLLALSSMTSSGVTYSDQTDARFLLAASLTLSQVGSDRTQCLNFRKKKFVKENRSREINFTALKKPLLAVGMVFFCLFLSLIVQSSVHRSQLKTVNTQLERSVRSFFGQISSGGLRAYMSNTNVLRTSINKELIKQRELSRLFGPNSRSPIDFLNSLSSVIPKDVTVDLVQFQSGIPPSDSFVGSEQNTTSSLTFLVTNPQSIEKLANSINGKINHMQRSKTEEVATAEAISKKWKITFSGKPTEDSYVK